MLLAVTLCLIFMNGKAITPISASPEYEEKIFSQDRVHSIDIKIEEETWLELLSYASYKEYVQCDITINGETIYDVGLRCKGNNSLNQAQKYDSYRYSLKVEFDHYISGRSYYGLDKLSLNSCFQDNARMKELLAMEMMRSMEVPASLLSYCYITVNGMDWGLYVALEEVEEAFARRNYGSDHGRLYKPDYMALEDENLDVGLCYISDNPEDYDNIFRNAKFKTSDADKHRLISSLRQLSDMENLEEILDVDQLLRYFVVQSFVVNLDSYFGLTGHNYYLYEENGKLSMLPWDYNLAFASYALGSGDRIDDPTLYVNYPIDTPAEGQYMVKRPMFHNLMQTDKYFLQYHKYYQELLDKFIYSGRLEQLIDHTRGLIAPYVQRDPSKFCSYEDFQLGVDTIESFCLMRAQSVQGQLDGQISSSFLEQSQDSSNFIDASSIAIADLGDFDDMKKAVWREYFP